MAENIKITRISDLPNSYLNMPGAEDPTQIHANPYGQAPPMGGMPPPIAQPPSINQQQQFSQPQQPQYQQPQQPQQQNQQNQQNQYTLSPEQIAMLQQMPTQSLPSRDMPLDTAGYMQDAQSTKPNYIPPPKRTDDYIAQYERQTEAKTTAYEKEKKREIDNEDTLDKIQMPIFLFVLYFIFQMPVINNLIFKRFSFLAIYNDLGNLNFNGILFKSILFCATFYSIDSTIKYLSDL